jgi:hypothetical protein
VRASVRSIRFPDMEGSEAIDPANTIQVMEIYAGPVDGEGEEQFQVTVCTPAALFAVLTPQQPILVGRHWLFMAEFSASHAEAFVRSMISKIEGADWSAVAEKIADLGRWEFEGYTPPAG